jgi:hypothetical protein
VNSLGPVWAEHWLPLLVTAVGLAIWGGLYAIFGREYRESDARRYVREPDDWTPIEVGYVWRWGRLTVVDLTAVTVDLVRRGVLRLTQDGAAADGMRTHTAGEAQYLQWIRDDGGLTESERYLISHILFPDASVGSSKPITDIHAAQALDPPKASARFFRWQELATKECRHIRLIDPKSSVAMGVGMALGLLMVTSAFEVAQFTTSHYAFLPAAAGLLLVPASVAIRRRNPEAAQALCRWQAFRRYLLDFSQLAEQTAPAVAIWEKYLVLAITLNVAKEAFREFSRAHPQIAEVGIAAGYPGVVQAFIWGLSVAFDLGRRGGRSEGVQRSDAPRNS